MLKSGKENYYRVYPKLVLSGTSAQITVEGLYEHSRFQAVSYTHLDVYKRQM